MAHHPNPFERPRAGMRPTDRWLALLNGRGVEMVSSVLFTLIFTGYFLLKGPVADRAREIQRAEPVAKDRPLWVLVLEDLDLIDRLSPPDPVVIQAGPPPPLPQPKRRPAPEWQPTLSVQELPFGLALTEAVAQAGLRQVTVLDARCPDANLCWAWGMGALEVDDLETLKWTPALRALRGPDDVRILSLMQRPSSWEGEPPFFALALRPDSDAYETRFAMHGGAAARVYEAGETDIEQALASEAQRSVASPEVSSSAESPTGSTLMEALPAAREPEAGPPPALPPPRESPRPLRRFGQ